jgi:hypothetical protein
MKTLIIFLSIVVSLNTYGQTLPTIQAPPNWKIPTNIEGICKNTEGSLVQLYKAEREYVKEGLNMQLTDAQRHNAWAMVEATKNSQRGDEDKWNKLGCIHFIKKQ